MTHDAEFAKKITSHLDLGTAALKQGTAYRLQLARQAALERLAEPERARSSQFVLAGASGVGGHRGRSLLGSGKLWLGILLIAAAGLGYHEWEAQQLLHDVAETDAALLTSDLPIDAYLDRGFQNWLTHNAEE